MNSLVFRMRNDKTEKLLIRIPSNLSQFNGEYLISSVLLSLTLRKLTFINRLVSTVNKDILEITRLSEMMKQ